MEGEAARRLQKCFAPGVIGVRHTKDGREVAVVNSARYDTGSRNVFRYDDLKDAVVMTRKQDHFICELNENGEGFCCYLFLLAVTIESVGAMTPDVIFKEAVKILKDKCMNLLEELTAFK